MSALVNVATYLFLQVFPWSCRIEWDKHFIAYGWALPSGKQPCRFYPLSFHRISKASILINISLRLSVDWKDPAISSPWLAPLLRTRGSPVSGSLSCRL
jgi:hypothetical protein